MPSRFQFSLRALLIAVLVAGAAFGWLVWPIECPVCHGGNVDAEGRCSAGEACPYLTDKWTWCDNVDSLGSRIPLTGSPGHVLMCFCSACKHRGTITRLDRLCSPEWPPPGRFVWPLASDYISTSAPMPRHQFNIRTVLWLMLVVAVASRLGPPFIGLIRLWLWPPVKTAAAQLVSIQIEIQGEDEALLAILPIVPENSAPPESPTTGPG